MVWFVTRRLLQAVAVAVGASTVVFFLLRQIPGDPAEVLAGPNASPGTVAAIRSKLALDDPFPAQFAAWLAHAARGDFGTSITTQRPVSQLIVDRLPATVELAVAAAVVTVVIGMLAGVVSAAYRDTWVDSVVTGGSSVTLGVSSFWLGTLAITVFSVELGWFPAGGWVDVFHDPGQGLRSLVLPAFVLGIVWAAVLARFVRASVLDVMSQEYVRTAQAKGLPGWVVLWRHIVRNALVPVSTMVGLIIGNLIAGAIVVEQVFSWPGIGTLLVQSVGNRDYPVTQGVILLMIAVFVLLNLVVDVLYGVFDPRTRT